jgi:membrane-bound lytic murein transglycosylase D
MSLKNYRQVFMRVNLLVIFFLLLGCSSVSAHKRSRKTKPIVKTEKKSEKKSNSLGLRYYKKHYKNWKKYFSTKRKKGFLRFLKNGARYKDIVENIMQVNGLPKELYYVGMIESGFYLKAKSHANAVGPWQFIKGTGKRYGLRIDKYVDERKSIFKSTWAAAQYFKDLYNIFGSWELALCAYNAGEYRIINAIRKGNTRDYRTLVRKKLLPKETILYIPKVVVAMELARKFDRHHRKDTNLFNEAYAIDLKRTTNLKKLRQRLNINRNIFLKLNPDIRKNVVKVVGRKSFQLFIPKNKKKLIKRIASSLKPLKIRRKRKKKTYRVRRGDTLYHLAKRFKIPVRKLLALNSLKGSKIRVGQRLVLRKAEI